jgi:hypothetical protein
MAWIRERPVGLVYRDPAQTTAGYTLFCASQGTNAQLLDAEGRIVQRWTHPEGIQHARLLDNGHLLAHTAPPVEAEGVEEIGGSAESLVELSWDSKVVWEHRDPFMHHDYARLGNGRHLVLRWARLPADVSGRVQGGHSHCDEPAPMWGDVVQEIAPDGSRLHEWRSWEHLSFEEDVICPLESHKEWTHANSIEVLPDGNWLISFRLTSTVAIVDRASGDFLWKWGSDVLSHQHSATWLDNGHVLIFDNGCHRRRMPSFSQVVEVDPATDEVVWRYQAPVILAFYSFMASGVSRLPDGNTLITECATGRIFEVTPGGETVWEYVSPFRLVHPKFGVTAAVPRAYRYPEGDPGLAGRVLDPAPYAELNERIARGEVAVGEE